MKYHDVEYQKLIEKSRAQSAERNAKAEAEARQDEDLATCAVGFIETNARLTAARLLQQFVWCNPLDLDDDETPTHRLMGAIAACVDSNGDGQVNEGEEFARQQHLDAVDELLEAYGISEATRDGMLIDTDPIDGMDAQRDLRELIPSTFEDFAEIANAFAFGPLMPDQTAFDAVQGKKGWTWPRRFKRRTTIHSKHGKPHQTKHRKKHKTWAKYSAKQHEALAKARLTAHTAAAMVLNARSNKRTREMGGRKVI